MSLLIESALSSSVGVGPGVSISTVCDQRCRKYVVVESSCSFLADHCIGSLWCYLTDNKVSHVSLLKFYRNLVRDLQQECVTQPTKLFKRGLPVRPRDLWTVGPVAAISLRAGYSLKSAGSSRQPAGRRGALGRGTCRAPNLPTPTLVF